MSKKSGGEWGLHALPQKFHTLIQDALQSYETDKEMTIDAEKGLEFADYMVSQIKECKSN